MIRRAAGGGFLRDAGGAVETVAYDDAEPVVLTRSFLRDPERCFRHLFTEDS